MRSTGNPPNKFAGRTEELNELIRALEQTQAGMPEHTLMYGSFGIGKTSLLFEFKKRIKNAYAVRVPLYATGNITDICDVILRESRLQLDLKPSLLKKRLKEFGFSFLGSGMNISLAEVQMNPQSALREIIGTIHNQLPKNSTLILMMDDLHRIAGEKGANAKMILSVLSNVLLLLNQEGQKIMFIGTGSPDIFRMIRDQDESSVRVFHPHEIPPLNYNETKIAIKIPAHKHKIEFDEQVIKRIYNLSEGIPYYIQVLAFYSYEYAHGSNVTLEAFEKGYIKALDALAQKEFKTMYENTSGGAKKVLAKMVLSNKSKFSYTEIKAAVESEVSTYLAELVEKNTIIKEGRGVYKFRDKLFIEYLKNYKPFMRNGTLNMKKSNYQ